MSPDRRTSDGPAPAGGEWIESTPPVGGVALLRAWFAGHAYARHRHDTYAVCVTDCGLQAFDYLGAERTSAPGQVAVLHPDEPDARDDTPDATALALLGAAESAKFFSFRK